MNDDVVVSVLCIAYNHEKYIRSALDGFVNQKTNFRSEVLINDDASTDHTAAIIAEYEAKYPDIIKPAAAGSSPERRQMPFAWSAAGHFYGTVAGKENTCAGYGTDGV